MRRTPAVARRTKRKEAGRGIGARISSTPNSRSRRNASRGSGSPRLAKPEMAKNPAATARASSGDSEARPAPSGSTAAPTRIPMRANWALAPTSAIGCGSAMGSMLDLAMPNSRENTSMANASGYNHRVAIPSIITTAVPARSIADTVRTAR